MYNIEEYTIAEQKIITLECEDSGLRATILPARGGMLVSLKKNEEEFIYCDLNNLLSDERPKCGMPVLFPVCGKLKDDVCPINGMDYTMPMHGLAQKAVWKIAETGRLENGVYARLCYSSDEISIKSYPFRFYMELEYRLQGDILYVIQTYKNCSEQNMCFSFGFHPYFCISSLQQIEFQLCAREIWIPSEDLREPAPEQFVFPWKGQKEYGAMASGCNGNVSFWDKGNGHVAEVAFSQEFPYVLLWSRPEKKFVCLEPWSAPANAFQTATETLSHLAPGESMGAQISIKVGIAN